jgi:thiol-disulfide isomerase/thioredoxin
MKFFLAFLCSLMLAAATPAASMHAKGNKPLSIAQGERVELTDFLVPGKFTIFDFTSEYCPPCRGYDEPLLLLHRQRANVAVVKVDINRPMYHKIDWESPVAQQYGLQSIPHFTIYGPDGKLVADDNTDERAARLLVDKMINALQ